MAARLALSLVLALVAACSHAGAGQGYLVSPTATPDTGVARKAPVRFSWASQGGASEGDIQATMLDGRHFEGTFLQVTASSRYDTYGPYWRSWTATAWGPWGPWYGGPQSSFATHYLGQVLAHLEGSDGSLMRCNFVLRDPDRGLAGGARGDCQLSTQEQVLNVSIDRT